MHANHIKVSHPVISPTRARGCSSAVVISRVGSIVAKGADIRRPCMPFVCNTKSY